MYIYGVSMHKPVSPMTKSGVQPDIGLAKREIRRDFEEALQEKVALLQEERFRKLTEKILAWIPTENYQKRILCLYWGVGGDTPHNVRAIAQATRIGVRTVEALLGASHRFLEQNKLMSEKGEKIFDMREVFFGCVLNSCKSSLTPQHVDRIVNLYGLGVGQKDQIVDLLRKRGVLRGASGISQNTARKPLVWPGSDNPKTKSKPVEVKGNGKANGEAEVSDKPAAPSDDSLPSQAVKPETAIDLRSVFDAALGEVFARLITDKQQKVALCLRWGIGKEERRSVETVADEMGVNRYKVSTLLEKAKRMLVGRTDQEEFCRRIVENSGGLAVPHDTNELAKWGVFGRKKSVETVRDEQRLQGEFAKLAEGRHGKNIKTRRAAVTASASNALS
jgi:hypothetical protein